MKRLVFTSIDGTFLSDDKSKVSHLKIVLVYSVKLEFKMTLYLKKKKKRFFTTNQ